MVLIGFFFFILGVMLFLLKLVIMKEYEYDVSDVFVGIGVDLRVEE